MNILLNVLYFLSAKFNFLSRKIRVVLIGRLYHCIFRMNFLCAISLAKREVLFMGTLNPPLNKTQEGSRRGEFLMKYFITCHFELCFDQRLANKKIISESFDTCVSRTYVIIKRTISSVIN